MPRGRAALLIALSFVAMLACSGEQANRGGTPPANALIPPAPPGRAATQFTERRPPAATVELVCDPGETETCVCADESTGSRRCNSTGNAFSPCDACPRPQKCGRRTCEAVRVDFVALTLPGCCPERSADQCGVDATFVAKNYGLSLGCLQFDAPGTPDASCPSVDVPIPERGNTTLHGCRARSGRCGYEVDVPNVLNLGCVEVR
jgi:hypothetical protein